MKQILTAIPLVIMMAGGTAYAQNHTETQFPTSDARSEVNGIFADDEGNMRPFDDFAERYASASDAQRAEAKSMCERYATDDAVTSPRVKTRCQAVADM